MAALQAVATGSGVGSHREWVGLTPVDSNAQSRSSPMQRWCSRRGIVHMTPSVDNKKQKQFVSTVGFALHFSKVCGLWFWCFRDDVGLLVQK